MDLKSSIGKRGWDEPRDAIIHLFRGKMDRSFVSNRSSSIKIIWYWLPVAAMFGTMFFLSTDTFSDQNTRSVIEVILKWWNPNTSGHAIKTLDFLARKSAHFSEYALLAVLLFRALRADSVLRWKLSWFLYSLALAACWSLLDELHQSYTSTRTPSIYDSMLDTIGAFFALAVFSLLTGLRKRGTEAPPIRSEPV